MVARTSTSFALDIAAPSLRRERDAPWTGTPSAHGEAGAAAMFWISFHGLSAFVHAVLITASVAGPMLLAIVPIPFIAAMCSEVKAVEKPIERVEMAIVELPPPPPPPPPEAPPVPVVDDAPVKVAKLKKVRAPKPDMVEFGMIAMLSTRNDSVFGALDSSGIEGGVVGGLFGDSVGDSYGAGGLGLRGVAVGEGGGGRGEGVGLGSLGTIGRGSGGGGTGSGYGRGSGDLGKTKEVKRVRVTLNEASSASRARLERMLTMCSLDETHSGTVSVVDDAVRVVNIKPPNACAIRQLQRTSFDADGTFDFTITPRTE